MSKIRPFIRPALFFAAFLFLLLWTKTLLWIAFLLLSIFFFAVDIYSVDKRKQEDTTVVRNYSGVYGVLGDYVVDATESFGLFIEILNAPVFIDIRRDEFQKQREQQAKWLMERQKELEVSLVNFINANPRFREKKMSCIGLHSKNLDQGEVFWEPSGQSLLRGISFLA
jgi:hypothetical protein